MYTTADEIDGDHYEDFLATCSFLFQDPARVDRLRHRFRALRSALTSAESLDHAEDACSEIGAELRGVMARTERLAATPDRDGMLCEWDAQVPVKPDDLRAYQRFGGLAETVKHHEPAEYWKSAPYLVNFMEGYKLKEGIVQAAADGRFADDVGLDPGPGLLTWDDVEAYQRIDPQNGRLRWLLHDLDQRRAFELLWIPPSMRYYDTGSVYESREAASLTKRLIFSGWAVVPKVISSMVSFEAERRAFAARSHNYTAELRTARRPASRLPNHRAHIGRTSAGRGGGRASSRGDDRVPAHLAEPQPRRARRFPAVGSGRPPPGVRGARRRGRAGGRRRRTVGSAPRPQPAPSTSGGTGPRLCSSTSDSIRRQPISCLRPAAPSTGKANEPEAGSALTLQRPGPWSSTARRLSAVVPTTLLRCSLNSRSAAQRNARCG